MSKKEKRSLRENIPWYVNKSLSPQTRDEVAQGFEHDPQARTEAQAWRQIQAALISQPQQKPSQRVRQRLMASIHQVSAEREKKWNFTWSVVTGALLAFSILILLWLVIRPGIVLQWSHPVDNTLSYRIYRAEQGSNQFELIQILPAKPGQVQYKFVDEFIFPGKNYIYKVEGIGLTGESSVSSTVIGQAKDVLPSQLALLLTSLIMGYVLVIIIRKLASVSLQKSMKYAR